VDEATIEVPAPLVPRLDDVEVTMRDVRAPHPPDSITDLYVRADASERSGTATLEADYASWPAVEPRSSEPLDQSSEGPTSTGASLSATPRPARRAMWLVRIAVASVVLMLGAALLLSVHEARHDVRELEAPPHPPEVDLPEPVVAAPAEATSQPSAEPSATSRTFLRTPPLSSAVPAPPPPSPTPSGAPSASPDASRFQVDL
jgi:hypothetical protein